ncbi:TPA: hypothetical protein ACJTYR_000397 [Streptococcus pyogenes]
MKTKSKRFLNLATLCLALRNPLLGPTRNDFANGTSRKGGGSK